MVAGSEDIALSALAAGLTDRIWMWDENFRMMDEIVLKSGKTYTKRDAE